MSREVPVRFCETAMDDLGLERADHCFGERVVVTPTLPTEDSTACKDNKTVCGNDDIRGGSKAV